VKRALSKRTSLLKRTKTNLDSCDGVCLLDGKTVRVQRALHTIFVAWDRGMKKPIHFLVRPGGEKELWYWKLLVDLKYVRYMPKAFVSDGILTLREFLGESFPSLPHQRCAVHVFLAARAKALAGGRTNERQKLFVELIRRIIWSPSLTIAKRRSERLSKIPGLIRRESNAITFVWQTLPDIFVCKDPRWKHLRLPRSSNAIENVMGQIEARLKTRRGTKSLGALETLVNELLLEVQEQTITHN
jgi:transposase-like protein